MKWKKMLRKVVSIVAVGAMVVANAYTMNAPAEDAELQFQSLANYNTGSYWSDWQMKGMGLDQFQQALEGKSSLPEVVVAVLDTGCNYEDAGFAGRVLVDEAICVTDAVGVYESSGHGTNTTRGVLDASPSNVKVLPVRVTNANGGLYESAIAKGIKVAVDAGADVIQICSGYYMGKYDEINADVNNAIKAADDKGVIVCISAGNDSSDTEYASPSCSPYCISVAAADNGMTLTYRSNYNAVITSYSHNDGTSYATPNVSAVAAMLKSIDRSVNRKKMVEIISTMAIDIGAKGKDAIYGNGFLYMGDYIQNGNVNCLHTYNRQELSTATCSSEGKIKFTCSKCGTTFTRTEDPRHQYIAGHTVADCEHDGVFHIECALCGDVKTNKVMSTALGHKYKEYSKSYICLRCNKQICKTHSYKVSSEVKGDCSNPGYVEYKCGTCGETYQEVTSATGNHTYTKEVIQPATCTEDGTAKFTCSGCGDSYTETIPASGHEYTAQTTRSASCNIDGINTYTCTKCGYFYTDPITSTGVHTYAAEVVQPATCTSDGITKYTCSCCGESYTETIPASGAHSYTAKVTKSATCKADGVKTYTCSKCGDTYTEAIPSTGAHTYKTSTTKKATCTTDGVRKYTCKTCKHSYEETIHATGHTVGKNNKCTVCKQKVTTSGKKR